MQPRILRHLQIDEVSSVDKGAGIGTRIVLMKRDTGTEPAAISKEGKMTDFSTATPEAIAKMAANAAMLPERFTKAEIYSALMRLAALERPPLGTTAQSFAKVVSEHPDGRALWAAYKQADGDDCDEAQRRHGRTVRPVHKRSEAEQRFNARVAEVRKAEPKLSQDQAMTKIITGDATDRALWAAYRAA